MFQTNLQKSFLKILYIFFYKNILLWYIIFSVNVKQVSDNVRKMSNSYRSSLVDIFIFTVNVKQVSDNVRKVSNSYRSSLVDILYFL